MNMLRALLLRVGGQFGKWRCDREFADELTAHLQMHIDDNLRAGMPSEEARRTALITLGGLAQTQERYREQRGYAVLDTFWQDLRFGLRMLHKDLNFTVVAVLTLSLGIGASTAIFSIVDETMLRPPPFAAGERLVDVLDYNRTARGGGNSLSPQKLVGWQAQPAVFEQFEGYSPETFQIASDGEPELVTAWVVTPGLFPMLGVAPRLGRGFVPSDGARGAEKVAIVSDGFWRSRYGADPNAVGRIVRLSGAPYRIVGVMPRRFQLRVSSVPPLFLPTDLAHTGIDTQPTRFYGMGRLPAGVDISEAQQRADGIAVRLQAEAPLPQTWDLKLMPKSKDRLDVTGQTALFALLGAVGLVLLVACANVASLLLARGATRGHEMAIRAALGASRARLVRAMLTESILLASLGGILGSLLARWLVQGLVATLPVDLAIYATTTIEVDGRVLAFTATVTLGTAILFGLLPALRGSHPWLNVAFRESGRHAVSSRPLLGMVSSLIVVDVALAIVLLVGAALMMRTFVNLNAVDPGFDPHDVVATNIPLPSDKYPNEAARMLFFDQLSARLSAMPGVIGVATAMTPLPFGGFSNDLVAEGGAGVDPRTTVAINTVGDTYFQTLRIPLLEGRTFAKGEQEGVVVNRTLERTFWPNEPAVGRRLRFGNGPWMTIVGVVGNVEIRLLDTRLSMQLYSPFILTASRTPGSGPPAPRIFPQRTLVVRAAQAKALTGTIKALARDIDPSQPVITAPLENLYAEQFARERFVLLMMSLFAGAALFLSAVGIFAVLSHAVTRRTHEIGVRIALGAKAGGIFRLIVAGGLARALVGTLIGLAGAAGLSRVLRNLLFGVGPLDPTSFIVAPVVLLTVALVACWLPTRRAIGVQPVDALRWE